MTYAELIKKLERYADKEVFFDGFESGRASTQVWFYNESEPFLKLSRRYGEDEIEVSERL